MLVAMGRGITVTLLAVWGLACSAFVGASAPASRVAALANKAEEKPAAGPAQWTETLWPVARAASAGGVLPSARKLFGVYDETTPTDAPTGAPTPIIAPCDGTFVDFEGVDVLILEEVEALFNLSDGSGVRVGYIANPEASASFVSNVSEARNISLAATTYTSGGVFATSGVGFDINGFENAVVVFLVFAEDVCEASFGFAVDSSEPVDAAIAVFADTLLFNASATPGEFGRASGFVHVDNNGTAFGGVTIVTLVGDSEPTLIIDNVCFTPCEA